MLEQLPKGDKLALEAHMTGVLVGAPDAVAAACATSDPQTTAVKSRARHAIELIADHYEQRDEYGRAGWARRSTDDQLLDVIKSVLTDLVNTENAYVNEKGSETQRKEIARLTRELKTAKGPQTDELARVNKRLGEVQQELDELRLRPNAPTTADLVRQAHRSVGQ